MGKAGPKKIARYGDEFKLNAVKLSSAPGVLIKDVADSLCVHPFLLSRWRKEVREGKLVGDVPDPDTGSVAELQRLREVEQKYKQLQQEHDLLKKYIGFAAERKRMPSPSSPQTGQPSPCS